MQFHPWRKGPFQLGEHFINTEWRSDWKWQRLIPHINLKDHRVLDIGCGNGYFGWRMLQAGAQEVVGIDPTLLFCMQHQVINHFVQSNKNWVLPLGIDEIPSHALFDTVMSMGVLYHRRNPQEHIEKMFALCKPKGCAVLETLIVTADKDLIPEDRYARMRNVWCVPRVGSVINSMQQAGFKDVAVVNQCVTTTEEQRSTAWMTFDSLLQTLDPDNSALTIEGHPAPNRAIVIGYRP